MQQTEEGVRNRASAWYIFWEYRDGKFKQTVLPTKHILWNQGMDKNAEQKKDQHILLTADKMEEPRCRKWSTFSLGYTGRYSAVDSHYLCSC